MEKETILNIFSKYYHLSGYSMTEWYEAKIPIETIKTSLFFRFYDRKIYLTSVNNLINYDMLNGLIENVNRIITTENNLDYKKIEISKIEIFDCVLFVNNHYHQWFKATSDELYKKIIYFNPINHCEFSGISGNEFPVLTRNITNPAEWKREISPLVMIKLDISQIGIKPHKKFKYEKEKSVYNGLNHFQENENWIEIKNYKDELLVINYNRTENKYELKNSKDIFNYEEMKEYIKLFLRN